MKRLVLALVCLVSFSGPVLAQPPRATDGVRALLGRLEAVIRTGDPDAYLGLLSQTAERPPAEDFADEIIGPGITRVTLRERDRHELPGTLPGEGYQILVEGLIEFGARARLVTWSFDVRHRGGSADEWGIADQRIVSSLQGLHRLSLDTSKQYAAQNLVISAEDVRISLESGNVFVAGTGAGWTALVLIGRGELTFSPTPKTEQGQVRLYAGAEVLQSPFEIAFVRVPPTEVDDHLDRSTLSERPVDPREMKRAEEVFRQDVGKSFGLDLGEFSPEIWSLLPNTQDFLAEVRTRRFDTLTYARSTGEIEDISLFDRKNHRNIAYYASKDHLKRYTRFYDEDDHSDYAVTHYDIEVAFNPVRRSFDGVARLAVETRAKSGTNSLAIRLAEPLVVRSVISSVHGRLLFVRVRNQNSIVVNLPGTITSGFRFQLMIEYSGVIPPQPIDREALWPQLQQAVQDDVEIPIEESYLYSNRSYWYPQPQTPGYATARVRLTVPGSFGCLASGDPVSVVPVATAKGQPSARQFTFTATQPLRYLAFLVTPLREVRNEKLRVASAADGNLNQGPNGVYYDEVQFETRANPRMVGRARELARNGLDILKFYTSIVGDCPYPTLTLAVVERRLPGGHSPAYLSVVSQPAPGSHLSFRGDPSSFPDFPEFFVAHEMAHEWWGQAVGWKNYHEQWLSEGFSQYFAALYSERARGAGVFESVMRRMRRWATEESSEGPIFLGYRIGHVKGDSRLFRAVVYDKSAIVLHMLRRLVGDRAFFAGVRRFYSTYRFHKAGSDDLRKAMEAEAGVPLERFFERWIYGQDLPQIGLTWKLEQTPEGQVAVLRFEQTGEVFDLPVTVTLDYEDKPAADVLVKITDKVSETRIPVTGLLRRIDVNRDELALGSFRVPNPTSN